MDEPIMAANPAEEAEPGAFSAQGGDAAAPASGDAPEGGLTKTQAFSRRLNAMTQKAVDEFVGSLGLTDKASGEPITTRAQYEAAKAAGAFSPAGEGAPALQEVRRLREALDSSRIREQDRALLSDPALGDAYRLLRKEALELTDYCRTEGGETIDLNAAFSSLLERNAGAILQEIRSAAANEAVRRAEAARLATPGRLGGGDVPAGGDYAAMSDAEFERQIALAKNGGLSSR